MENKRQFPRRILFASAGLTIGGGIANLANSTLRALDQFVSDGEIDRVDVLVLHGSAPPDRPRSHGDVVLANSSNRRFAAMYARHGRARRTDLTIFDMPGVARSARLVPPPLRSPFAMFAHGHEFDPPVSKDLLWPITHAAKILAVSATTERRLRGIELPSPVAPVEVLPNCVASDRIEAWSRLNHARSNNHDPIVLTVGRLNASDPGKGHDTLINALPLIKDRIPQARLVIVGEGDNRHALEKMAQEAGVAGSVTFTGFVSDEELGRMYQSAMVFAMPSRQEGFGIVYAEAMWHGLPCIGSTADAAVDVIVDGETGLLVPYGDVSATADALTRILGDTDYARALGANGRIVCLDRYTPDSFHTRLRMALAVVP